MLCSGTKAASLRADDTDCTLVWGSRSGPLKQIVREVVLRLDAEYGAALAEVLREPMGSQAAKAPR